MIVAVGFNPRKGFIHDSRRVATAYDDLAFLAFFAPWRLGVLKMNSHTAAKGGPTSTRTANSNCRSAAYSRKGLCPFFAELSADDEDIAAHENGDLAGEVCFAGVIFW